MIGLIVFLVICGMGLYLLEQIPIDAQMRAIIRVVVILCVVLYLLSAFGIFDIPIPRLRRP